MAVVSLLLCLCVTALGVGIYIYGDLMKKLADSALVHCSLLAEDAIKSAIKDYQTKRAKRMAMVSEGSSAMGAQPMAAAV